MYMTRVNFRERGEDSWSINGRKREHTRGGHLIRIKRPVEMK